MPTIADDIQAIAPFTFPYGVVVDAPGAIANSMAVGIWGHRGELNITAAGSLSVTGNLLGSQGDGDQGSVINNDGALIVGSVLRLAGNGVGTLNMNGGTVEANQLWMASVEGTATLNMNGGIITADTFTMSLNSIAQLIILLLAALAAVPTSASEQPQPSVVLVERNPWLMVIGSDSPTFVLYSDGLVIFRNAESSAYLSAHLTEVQHRKLLARIAPESLLELGESYSASECSPSGEVEHWGDLS